MFKKESANDGKLLKRILVWMVFDTSKPYQTEDGPRFYRRIIKRGDIKMSEPPGCCICLDEVTTPASLPCGHCFCLGCIGEYWRIHDSCQCPLCKAVFPDRTRLQTGQAPQTQDAAAPLKAGEVACDFCRTRRPAVKSCMRCLASYCAAHLEPHYRSDALGRHLLIGVAKNLEDSVCRLHGRRLERFCKSDQTCICTKCARTEHRGHRITSVSQEAAKKKVKLNHRRLKLQQEIQQRLGQVEKMKLSTAERTQNGELARQLEEEITELQGADEELERLSHTEDSLHFLQRFPHCERDDGSKDMASSSNSPGDSGSLQKHLSCSVCMETFKDPVTTACGHTFCRKCLDLHIEHASSSCPLCKTHLNKAPSVNIVLRDIIQLNNKPRRRPPNEFTGGPGEVRCDVCTEPNLKAEKSCLVCLASYCSTHIQNHYSAERLKGHKLVEPVGDMDARACLIHGRPLELFSRNQQKCVCVQCIDRQEEVVSAEEECQAKKAQLDDIKKDFQQKIRERRAKMDEINTALRSCKDQLDSEWWDIDNVFQAVLAIVEAAQKAILKPVEEKRRSLETEAEGHSEKLKAEIKKLEILMSEIDDFSALEDHMLFLQRFPSVAVHSDLMDWTGVKLDTSLSFGTMIKTTTMAMEKIQQELHKLSAIELRRVPKFTVDVKLDPATAHKRLVVSDDGKEVKDGGEEQELEDSPARFDLFGSVLGLCGLASGKSYWEVEVGHKTGWDLGVVRGSSSRRGKLKVNPDHGFWALVHYEEENYAAMTEPPLRLSPRAKPKKVGVFVDYEEGLVSFYDVTARSHIYSFHKCSFTNELYPYFSPHVKQGEKNSEPLVISAEKQSEGEVEREQMDANMSLQVCHYCGWSKVTTYRGLRIHQSRMGCTPKGARVADPEQQQRRQEAEAYNPDLSLWVCQYCGWRNVTTYRGLRIHQGRVGCTPKGVRIPRAEHYHQELFWKELRPQPQAKRDAVKEQDFPEPPKASRPRGSAAAQAEAWSGSAASAAPRRYSLGSASPDRGRRPEEFSKRPQVDRPVWEPSRAAAADPTCAVPAKKKNTKRQTSPRKTYTGTVEELEPSSGSPEASARRASVAAPVQQLQGPAAVQAKRQTAGPPADPSVRPKERDGRHQTLPQVSRPARNQRSSPPVPPVVRPKTKGPATLMEQREGPQCQLLREIQNTSRRENKMGDEEKRGKDPAELASETKTSAWKRLSNPPPVPPRRSHSVSLKAKREKSKPQMEQETLSCVRGKCPPGEKTSEKSGGVLSATQTAAAHAAKHSPEEDPTPPSGSARPDLGRGRKVEWAPGERRGDAVQVRELAQRFSNTEAREKPVGPGGRVGGGRGLSQATFLDLKISVTTDQETAAQPKEEDGEGEELQTVRQLVRMFSAMVTASFGVLPGTEAIARRVRNHFAPGARHWVEGQGSDSDVFGDHGVKEQPDQRRGREIEKKRGQPDIKPPLEKEKNDP
ncbi:unnamed protein product [Menidia menidia]|uniref:(Atlantic silverside) hypothetical protein n=1 Tax=Menidia menidia TaxID=238744 RepID=A0A8S4B9P5_9TELE|nr:unnamed protein product [Menidia menidia]